MPDPDVATLSHRLAALTRRAMGERMAHETWAHEAGFRPGCIGVLHVVAAREPVSQREVSDALLLDPSDVVTLVDILERAGLVERKRDPADRRRYALEVTAAGQLAVVRLREITREANQELLAPLDPDEREQLAVLLARVVRHHTGHIGHSTDSPPEPPEPPADPLEDGGGEMRPVLPGHPEKAAAPLDPNAEAERVRGRAPESTRP
jgi:DNA-binding MarR family transcriptional regulator